MKKFDAFSTLLPQSRLGVVRPRLYTITEAAEELGVTLTRAARACKKHGVKPVFDLRPFKYTLNDVKEALNQESEEPTYVIEKAIPIPRARGREMSEGAERALLSMEVGDSILIPANQLILFYKAAKDMKVNIVTRKTETDEVRRLWRIAA